MKGTHGTCRSRSESIKKNGFDPSLVGKRGSGVYFWAYQSDDLESYVRDLAIKWWDFAKNKQGVYSKDSDKRCSIVFSEFDTDDDSVLDLESQTIREKFILYTEDMYHKLKGTEDEKISASYNMFVNDIESKVGRQFDLIHVKIQSPKGFKPSLPIDILGQPSCYIVKDRSCITILKHEDDDNE